VVSRRKGVAERRQLLTAGCLGGEEDTGPTVKEKVWQSAMASHLQTLGITFSFEYV
jgi:hypothetical protein